MSTFLEIVARGGLAGSTASDALMLLIRQGFELGEMADREILDPVTKETRAVKAVPCEWMARLDRAAEVGAFEKKTAQEIAERILTTEAP